MADRMLESSARGADGSGDLFDLIDADLSGELSAKEVLVAFSAFEDFCDEMDKVQVREYKKNIVGLFGLMAEDAGWPKSTKLSQLPYLTREVFESYLPPGTAYAVFQGVVEDLLKSKVAVQRSYTKAQHVRAAEMQLEMALSDF